MSKHARRAQSPPPTPPAESNSKTLLFIALAGVLALAVGGLTYMQFTPPQDTGAGPPAQSQAGPAATAPAQTAAPAADAEPPSTVRLEPHPQKNLPPLPMSGAQPVRPMSVVTAVYRFAAEHPEVLSYMPCYCGCEGAGHRGNDDCFVTARAANGDVTDWEPHGMT